MAKTDKPADDETQKAPDAARNAAGQVEAATAKAAETAEAAGDKLDSASDDAAATAETTQSRAGREQASTLSTGRHATATATPDAPPSGSSYGPYDDPASFAYAPPVQAGKQLHPGEYSIGRVFAAEIFGAFVLVLAGLGIGMYNTVTNLGGLSVALGFGLGVMVSAYAFGWISGGHFNPAVTLGAALAGRVRWARVPAYWLAQLIGSLLAAGLLWVIRASMVGADSVDAAQLQTFKDQMFKSVANGYGSGATGSALIHFPLITALLAEIIVTMVFILVILGSTAKKANNKFAPLAIGLTLAVGLMILMPITNGSMNPTRSIAAAIFAGGEQLKEVWVFILAPLLGGALGGLLYPLFAGFGREDEE